MLTLCPTPIPELFVMEATVVADKRGTFCRAFCDEELAPVLKGRSVRQINLSRTASPGAIRGLHFQHPPQAEMKFVRCLRGRVWDVALDLRQGSPSFLRWYAQELSPQNARMMVIPEGFAHGFQVLESDSELLYLHTAPYSKPDEGGVRFDDPAVQIDWPLPPTDISARDAQHAWLPSGFTGLAV